MECRRKLCLFAGKPSCCPLDIPALAATGTHLYLMPDLPGMNLESKKGTRFVGYGPLAATTLVRAERAQLFYSWSQISNLVIPPISSYLLLSRIAKSPV